MDDLAGFEDLLQDEVRVVRTYNFAELINKDLKK
jgi:hypothetical protein